MDGGQQTARDGRFPPGVLGEAAGYSDAWAVPAHAASSREHRLYLEERGRTGRGGRPTRGSGRRRSRQRGQRTVPVAGDKVRAPGRKLSFWKTCISHQALTREETDNVTGPILSNE